MPESWKETSDRTDAIQFILKTVDCPPKVRNLIDILLGISEGRLDFETTRKEIASRLRDTYGLVEQESAIKAVQRMLRQLKKWQEDNQLNLIEYLHGSRNKEGTIINKSRYHLHIIPIADEVIALAKTYPLWDIDRAKAIDSAVMALKSIFAPHPVMPQKRRSGKLPRSKKIEMNIRAGITNFRNAMQILEEDKSIIVIDDKVVDEIEGILRELKKRLLTKESFYKDIDDKN